MVAMKEGNLKEAEEIFRKAYAANPKDSRDLVGLVETLAGQGHYDQAIQFLQSELAKNPKRNDLQMALGNVAVRAGISIWRSPSFKPCSTSWTRIPKRAARFTSGWASRCAKRET
jgi:tetratricopeptide (TPR) repeat protein